MKERQILFTGPMVRALQREVGPKTQTRRVMNPQPQWRANWGSAVGLTGAWLVGSPAALGLRDRGDHWMSELDDDTRRRICTQEAYGWGANAGCPYGVSGDLLRVRETFFAYGRWETRYSAKKGRDEWHFIDMTVECDRIYRYAADNPDVPLATNRGGALPGWWKRPAIFMPRAASRISLEVTSVRVERLQEISETDAIAEGIEPHCAGWLPYRTMFYEADGVTPANFLRDPRDSYRTLWESINGANSWEANPWVWVVEFKRLAA